MHNVGEIQKLVEEIDRQSGLEAKANKRFSYELIFVLVLGLFFELGLVALGLLVLCLFKVYMIEDRTRKIKASCTDALKKDHGILYSFGSFVFVVQTGAVVNKDSLWAINLDGVTHCVF